MKTSKIRIGHNLYPQFDDDGLDYEKVRELAAQYDIGIDFLFEDGIEFSYDSNKYTIRRFPGDVAFYDEENQAVVLYIEDLFGQIEFHSYWPKEECLLVIKVGYDSNMFSSLDQLFIREIEENAKEMEKEETKDETV